MLVGPMPAAVQRRTEVFVRAAGTEDLRSLCAGCSRRRTYGVYQLTPALPMGSVPNSSARPFHNT